MALVFNSEQNYPTHICCVLIWIWTRNMHTKCQFCSYKSIILLLSEWPESVPEVPSTKFQSFWSFRENAYLSEFSFFLKFIWHCYSSHEITGPVLKRQLIHLALPIILKSSSYNISIWNAPSVIQELDEDSPPHPNFR